MVNSIPKGGAHKDKTKAVLNHSRQVRNLPYRRAEHSQGMDRILILL